MESNPASDQRKGVYRRLAAEKRETVSRDLAERGGSPHSGERTRLESSQSGAPSVIKSAYERV